MELRTTLAGIEDSIEKQKEIVSRVRKQSNIGKRFSSRTFETFDKTENELAYKTCKWYVSEGIRRTEKNGLILCGMYGTGKTHLAAAIANDLMDTGISVLFNTYNGHLEKIKKDFDAEKPVGYLEKMYNAELLIIDDVGKERGTEWTESVMFDVINNRYENMKPIVITTNLDSRQLEIYFGGAVYSRLVEMCNMVVTTGKDHRR